MVAIAAFRHTQQFLLTKALRPLESGDISELNRIQALDVHGYSEADVRGEIIDPILRIIGYRKGQYSSVDREKHISFRGKTSRYIDYTFTLWSKNFWLIEAKKPLPATPEFGYKELRQAVEYAAHPEIEAALVVLCDGLKIEVFDREVSVSDSILRVDLKNLVGAIDDLRRLLDPIQVWYYYRRRVIRALDRAFEHEINLNRLNEFKDIVDRHLDGMRGKVLDNAREMNISGDDSYLRHLAEANRDELIDVHFFFSMSATCVEAMTDNLAAHCAKESPFHTLHRVFPDEPRDANDFYYPHAIALLMKLERSHSSLGWTPAWLCSQGPCNMEHAISALIRLCLTHFEAYPLQKCVLLAANAYRRIFKILATIEPQQREAAEVRHLITRHIGDEFDISQILSCPDRNVILGWDRLSLQATLDYVKKHDLSDTATSLASAKLELKKLWEYEKHLLETSNYRELRYAFNFGELAPTEASGVVYDNLGHASLCIIKRSPKWVAHLMNNHLSDIEYLAATGSWSAKELLGLPIDVRKPMPVDANKLATRFFFSDLDTFHHLSGAYGYRHI